MTKPSPYIYPGLSTIPLELDNLLSAVCRAASLNKAEVRARSRKRETVAARQLYCYFARKYTGYSYAAIGAVLGSYDHASVIHSDKKIKDMISVKDPLTMNLLNKIQITLNN